MAQEILKQTPLHAAHVALGARMVPFGGWDMPVQYATGIIKEHKAVRGSAGLFDVSHMGEGSIRGPRAGELVQKLVTNDASRLVDGQALYTVMCLPTGGIVDDCIVYRRSADHFLIILNASNIDKDLAWLREHAGAGAEVVDESPQTALIAVQGPTAVALANKLSPQDLAAVERFHFATAEVAGVANCMVARTGYTGEDGFEIACPADGAEALWSALVEAGGAPCGLGARDTLRLEARLSLYGNDIDETTTPYEAGLGWVVKLGVEADFIGKQALVDQKAAGLTRKLVGFRIEGRGAARHGYKITDGDGGPELGLVTSGAPGISVGGAIGMGYVPVAHAKPDTELTIDCRGKPVKATVVKGPFYKRES